MASPYFYFAHLATMPDTFALNENSSRHIVQVLRMQAGENIRLTDGRGLLLSVRIREAHKKRCLVTVIESEKKDPAPQAVQIGCSLLKNTSRFEWFLEKATELGISAIFPLKCARTEKQQFRMDRWQGILESALIQSQQVWMPVLSEPQPFNPWVESVQADQKFIGHCEPGDKQKLAGITSEGPSTRLILIGPEGDFTPEEIALAVKHQFIPVELGNTRLRSETAALAAAVVLKLS